MMNKFLRKVYMMVLSLIFLTSFVYACNCNNPIIGGYQLTNDDMTKPFVNKLIIKGKLTGEIHD